MKKFFPLFVRICLISVYIIILAGATVRMTGSGMGCPDWPKCFGHLIPPTSEEELKWKPNLHYTEGQIIIVDEALLVAKKKFTTSDVFNPTNWQNYTKHDYADFNVIHTWVEYINRLVTAVAGVFFLLLIISSLGYWKERRNLVLLSFLAMFLMLFEAWLGKTVVDTNLAASKITIHMLGALFIVAVLLVLNYLTNKRLHYKSDKRFTILLIAVFILTVAQIILGIDVREFVDNEVKNLGFESKGLIELENHTNFLIHRSFSIAVVILNIWLFIRNRTMNLGYRLPFWIVLVLAIEILAGVLMFYFEFPFGTQVIHLLFAALLFGLQFYLILQVFGNKRANLSIQGSPSNV